MKALIIYDGSEASQRSLKTASQDAYARQKKIGKSPVKFEALISAFEFMPQDDQTLRWNSVNNRNLELVGACLESKGAFDQIKTKYIQYQGNPTDIVIELAKLYGADSIYLPNTEFEEFSPQKPGLLKWLGLVKPTPVNPFSTVDIITSQLLKKTSCKVIITDAQGLFMKFSYYHTNANAILQKV
jgi:hypothetical protein